MPLILQIVITGLAAGAVYGLVATGYALIYRLTGVVQFALGEVVGLSVFVTLLAAAGTGPVTRTNVPAGRYLVSLGAGLLVAVVLGGLVYLLAVRPFLFRGSTLGWIGAIVALAFAVRGLLSATLVRESYVVPDAIPFDRVGERGVVALGAGVTVPVRAFFVIAVGVALAAAASWLLERTRTGQALRAIASDAEAARIVGLPIDRLLVLAFALAGALAALAAVVAAPGAPFTAETGGLLGLKGLVAALLVRFGSPWHALGAGIGLGVLETSVAGIGWLGPAYRDVIPLALAVALLAIGTRGEREALE